MSRLIFIIIFILIISMLIISFFIGKNTDNVNINVEKLEESNYITPQDFSVGIIADDNPKFANNCKPNTLYPINSLNPNQGLNFPSNCRCTEFIQPP